MINVGLIGLGPFWEQRYRPVLERFRSRIRVCAVYDQVASRAQMVAQDFNAHLTTGISALVARPDVRAVLILDSAWQGCEPFRMVLARKKSAYIAGSLGTDVETIARRHLFGLSEGLTLMPEFSRRYTPATTRLQELMATQIGPPHRVRVQTILPHPKCVAEVPGQANPRDFLVGLVDWCRHIIRLPPSAVEIVIPEPGAVDSNVEKILRIEFNKSRAGGEAPVAEFFILRCEEPRPGEPIQWPKPRCEIVCARGRAMFTDPMQIAWSSTGEEGGEEREESLVSERSEVEVMLDHFCRRVVGGLIPVADLADICGHLRLIQEAERSLAVGRPVRVSPYN